MGQQGLSPSVPHLEERNDLDPSPYYRNKTICACGKEVLHSPRFLEDFIRVELLSNNIGDGGATAVADAIAVYDANKTSARNVLLSWDVREIVLLMLF